MPDTSAASRFTVNRHGSAAYGELSRSLSSPARRPCVPLAASGITVPSGRGPRFHDPVRHRPAIVQVCGFGLSRRSTSCFRSSYRLMTSTRFEVSSSELSLTIELTIGKQF